MNIYDTLGSNKMIRRVSAGNIVRDQGNKNNPAGVIQHCFVRWMETAGYLMGFSRSGHSYVVCSREPDVGDYVQPARLDYRLELDPLRSIAGRDHPLLDGALNVNHSIIRNLARKVAIHRAKNLHNHKDRTMFLAEKRDRIRAFHQFGYLNVRLLANENTPRDRDYIRYALACYASNPPKENLSVPISPRDVKEFRSCEPPTDLMEIVKANPSTAWIFDYSLDPPSNYTGPSRNKLIDSDYEGDLGSVKTIGQNGKPVDPQEIHAATQTCD